MKLLLLACILAGTMSAQNPKLTGLSDYKIELAGNPENPFVINGSDKTIVGYVTIETDDSGIPIDTVVGGSPNLTMCNPLTQPQELPIAPGAHNKAPNRGVRLMHPDGRSISRQTVVLDSVLLSDGTLVGPNKADVFRLIQLFSGMDKAHALKALTDPARFQGGKK